jgi:hypothetical protein
MFQVLAVREAIGFPTGGRVAARTTSPQTHSITKLMVRSTGTTVV